MRRFGRGGSAQLWAGVVASLVMLATMLGLRLLTGTPTLPELVQDLALAVIPGDVLSFLLERLLHLAKPLFLIGLVALQFVVGVILAVGATSGISRLAGGAALPVRLGLGAAAGLMLGGALAASFGPDAESLTSAPIPVTGVTLLMLLPYLAYGLVLGTLTPPRTRPGNGLPTSSIRLDRRRLLGRLVAGTSAVIIGGALW